MSVRRKVGILISGRGSNMDALLAASAPPDYPAEANLVISNRPDAAGLRKARDFGVTTLVIDHKSFSDRESFDRSMTAALEEAGVEIVALAGFMRILSAPFVTHWRNRLINIHPSLLPLFPGLDTHARALNAGVKLHGCTVHFVRPEMDTGPIIGQAAVPVITGDTPESLAARVLTAEHRLYPQCLKLVAAGRVRIEDEKAQIEGVEDAGPALLSPAPN